jgi:hypothetical protein
MQTNMKQARIANPKTKPTKTPAPSSVCKSVSMPPEMWQAVEQRIAQEPDLDFSKLVRRLFRAHLATAKA